MQPAVADSGTRPIDRHADTAPEHPLRGAGTPRRKLHHLLDSVQSVIVAHAVDKCGQRRVRRLDFTSVCGDRAVETCGRRLDIVLEMYWCAEQVVVDWLDPSGPRGGVTAEACGKRAGPKPRTHHRAALADGGAEHPIDHAVHECVRQRKPMARAVTPRFRLVLHPRYLGYEGTPPLGQTDDPSGRLP